MRALTPTRCLAVLIALSCLLVFALVPRYDLLDEGSRNHVARGLFDPPTPSPTDSSSNSAGGSNTSSADSKSAQPSSTQNAQSSSEASPSPTQSNNQPSNTASSSSDSQSASQTSDSASQSSQQQQPTASASSASQVVTTGEGGNIMTMTTFVVVPAPSASDSDTAAQSSSTSNSDSSGSDDSGLSSSTIIGISVAGGVALIGIVAFFVWKFTHKRFSDLDGDEAIKWPDLNTHSDGGVPLPTNQTGRAGYDTGSEAALSRNNSHNGGYAGSLAATSTTELYPSGPPDPYAIPPLPHMNPNQPYRDEPDFYDPYRGPVPPAFGDGAEAIPMTQMAARTRSPGPGALYDVGAPGRSASPAPSMGRRSPAPQAALGYGDAPPGMYAPGYGDAPPGMYAPGVGPGMVMDNRARSPGPGAGLAMAPGRQSPGPQAAYGYR